MKVKVLKKFIDKHNRSILHRVGDVLEISKERFSEIVEKDRKLIEVLEDEVTSDEGEEVETSKKAKNKVSAKK